MIVLGIETSTARSSVALLVEGALVAHEHHEDPRGHGAFLAPAMRRCLDAAPRADGPTHVDAVAVGTGPGLYTGLRVGMATAAAFSSARAIPVVGVGGLDALAHGCGLHASTVVTTLDARRGQVFWAVHAPEHGELVRCGDPRVGTRAELDGVLAALDGPVVVVGEVAAETPARPDAADTARLARTLLTTRPHATFVPAALTPVYLRDADVRIGWAERGGVRGGVGSGAGSGAGGDERPMGGGSA
jgi:tRNA threonylcarbamoyladenosine biosynthesis protein TsaB